MIVVYLTDNSISVAVGTGGTPASIESFFDLSECSACVRDGIIVDADSFVEHVGEFWRAHSLPTDKPLKLIVASQRFSTRTVDMPYFKRKRDLEAYLYRDCAALSRIEKPVFGYRMLREDKEAKTSRARTIVVDASILEQLTTPFERMGLTVSAVSTPYDDALDVFTNYQRGKTQGTDLVMSIGKTELSSLLLSGDKVAYSTEQHLFNEYGTQAFASEIVRGVSGIEQFMHSSKIAEDLNAVHLFGLDDEAFELCRSALAAFEEGLVVDSIPEAAIAIPKSDVSPTIVTDWMPIALGLAAPEAGTSLIANWKTFGDNGVAAEPTGKEALKKALLPPGICLAACVLVIAVLLGMNGFTQMGIDAANAKINTPEGMKAITAYTSAKSDADVADATVSSASRLKDSLDTYPIPGANIESRISACAKGLVDYKSVSYDSATGAYVILATASNTDKIDSFVGKLSQEKAFDVGYNGYAYQQSVTSTGKPGKGDWHLDITLSLHAGEGR